MLFSRPTSYADATPLRAVKKNGFFQIRNPIGEPEGTYVIEVTNTTDASGRRIVLQRVTRMDDGTTWTDLYTATETTRISGDPWARLSQTSPGTSEVVQELGETYTMSADANQILITPDDGVYEVVLNAYSDLIGRRVRIRLDVDAGGGGTVDLQPGAGVEFQDLAGDSCDSFTIDTEGELVLDQIGPGVYRMLWENGVTAVVTP